MRPIPTIWLEDPVCKHQIAHPGKTPFPRRLIMEPATITAIATPPGTGGIGIIRISGGASRNILSAIFRRPGTRHLARKRDRADHGLTPHQLHLGYIVDPRAEEAVVDEVLAVYMPSPRSYTKEDVVEIQSHSGYIVLDKILQLVMAHGARLAEPGEFTRRAFMNGRIDLTQAEAVIDMIHAKTGKSLDIAAGQLAGNIGQRISEIRDNLVSVLAEIEADIEFSDDPAGPDVGGCREQKLASWVAAPLEELIEAYEHSHYFRDGLRMAIVGRPNVGKSSLLNRLINRERAIVTEIPGTTRDTIEEMVNINGLPVIVIDTAGLHDTTQQIEKMGIERTHATIQAADIVLLVVDLSQGVVREDHVIYQQVKETNHLVVMNKVDLNESMVLPFEWAASRSVSVSALAGTNMGALREAIFAMGVGQAEAQHTSSLVPNRRQADGLKRALAVVKKVLDDDGRGIELAALDLGAATGELDRILGTRYSEDVLDQIFKRFCIGK